LTLAWSVAQQVLHVRVAGRRVRQEVVLFDEAAQAQHVRGGGLAQAFRLGLQFVAFGPVPRRRDDGQRTGADEEVEQFGHDANDSSCGIQKKPPP
jgi:hypothetical protein